jgi:hypothetical protein
VHFSLQKSVRANTFFDGDPESFRDRGGAHATFRALAGREDLHVSHVFIWRAVNVVDQLRLLPENIAEALPLSHHTLLLTLKNEKSKVNLARLAAKKGWSKRKLEEEIRRVRAREKGSSKAGRPALPRFVKGFTKLMKAIKEATNEPLEEDVFSTYPPEKAKALLHEVDLELSKLESLRKQVKDRLVEWEKRPDAS